MATTDSTPAIAAPDTRRGPDRRRWLAAAAASLAAFGARGHGAQPHSGPVKKEQKDWGIAGDPKSARRTIDVRMLDSMRFEPPHMSVRLNETIRFNVRNTGRQMHEFVLGTKQENEAHAQLMLKFPDMEHDEPYMAHVPPGKAGRIVWHFNRAGTFEFACLIAGHYQAGMTGTIVVAA